MRYVLESEVLRPSRRSYAAAAAALACMISLSRWCSTKQQMPKMTPDASATMAGGTRTLPRSRSMITVVTGWDGAATGLTPPPAGGAGGGGAGGQPWGGRGGGGGPPFAPGLRFCPLVGEATHPVGGGGE